MTPRYTYAVKGDDPQIGALGHWVHYLYIETLVWMTLDVDSRGNLLALHVYDLRL